MLDARILKFSGIKKIGGLYAISFISTVLELEKKIMKRVGIIYQSTVEAKVWELKLRVYNIHHIEKELAT